MAAAFGWGLLAGSSLVIGAVVALRLRISLRSIGLIMGFGAGVLISAVAFDLVEEAADKAARSGWGHCGRLRRLRGLLRGGRANRPLRRQPAQGRCRRSGGRLAALDRPWNRAGRHPGVGRDRADDLPGR